MNVKNTAALALLVVCAGQMAMAETEGDPPFPGFGTWQGACDAWGMPAICHSTWRQGLSPDHVIQDYEIRSRADHSPIFAGRGLYKIEGETVTGVWEDSRGAILDLSGTYQDGKLRVIWGSAQVEIGRSVYVWDGNQMKAKDSVLTDEGWRDFMVIDYPAP